MKKRSGKTASVFEAGPAPRRGRSAPIDLLGWAGVLCGVFGLLFSADALFDLMAFRYDLICWAVPVFALLLSVLERLLPRFRGLAALGLTAAALLVFWTVCREEVENAVRRLIWYLTGHIQLLPNLDTSFLMVLIALPLTFLLHLAAFHFHAGRWLLLLTLPLLAAPASFGRGPEPYAALMLLVFHVLAERARVFAGSAPGRGGVATAVLLGVSAALAAVLILPNADALYDLPRALQQKLLPENTDPDDLSRRASLHAPHYSSGEDMLVLETDVRPSSAVYLKNFIGTVYRNGSWAPTDPASVFEALEAEGVSDAEVRFENRAYAGFSYLGHTPRTLTVRRVSGGGAGAFTPYGGTLVSTKGRDDTFRWFPEWASWRDGLAPGNWTSEGFSVYGGFVRENALDVPEELERLRALCASRPAGNLEEAVRSTLSYLSEHVEYTLSPGITPPGVEPTEYAVFENRRGFCVHFATAAALMLRSYGYPARYVSGYVAQPSAFERGKDGGFSCTLTDASAHAWVEVWDSAAGWRVIEATPSGAVVWETAMPQNADAYGETYEPAPAATARPVSTARPQTTVPPQATAAPADVPRPEKTESDALQKKQGEQESSAWETVRAVGVVLGGALCLLLLVFLLFRAHRGLVRARRSAPPGRMLLSLVWLLRRCGMLAAPLSGTEKDFAARFAEAAGVDFALAERVHTAALAARFGEPKTRAGRGSTADARALFDIWHPVLFHVGIRSTADARALFDGTTRAARARAGRARALLFALLGYW